MTEFPIAIPENGLTILDSFEADLVKADEYARNAKSSNTMKAYVGSLKSLAKYCRENGLSPDPITADIIRGYVVHLAKDHKYATIRNRLILISALFRRRGIDFPLDDPRVKETIEGIRRQKGVRQDKKAPILVDDIRKVVALFPPDLLGIRDKALFLLGWSGAFRRSELVGIDLEDIDFSDPRGIIVLLRKSKTDQAGEGQIKAIPYTGKDTCPVKALKQWLEAGKITGGPVFRPMTKGHEILGTRLSDKAVARLVKKVCGVVGLDPERFSGHSLRAGVATQVSLSGGNVQQVMALTGHKKADTAMGYIRNSDPFKNSPLLLTGV